ncbi:TPA: hypothetical protein ACMX4R_000267 [Yersinia enterocolitica]
MLNWTVHVKKTEPHFLDVCEQAKKAKFFEGLYVSHNDRYRQIQLFAGQHPIEVFDRTHDALGCITNREFDIECGAALVLSQSFLGDVAVILYPYSSKNLSRIQTNIIWAVFSDPRKITDTVLKSATKDFFCYMRVSSTIFSESRIERLRIKYLEFRSKKYVGDGSIIKLIFYHWSMLFLGRLGQ